MTQQEDTAPRGMLSPTGLITITITGLRVKISHEEAAATEKTLLSRVNKNPGTGIQGARMVETYLTVDGRKLLHEYGNGWGEWFVGDAAVSDVES